jgi:hypothetical protein
MAEAMFTFEENGFPVELITERDIRKAVASGRLRRDTAVKIHFPGQPIFTRRADEVEDLRPFLGIDEAETAVEADAVPAGAFAEASSQVAPPSPVYRPPPSPPVPPTSGGGGMNVFLDEETHFSAQDTAYAPPPPMQPQNKPVEPWILPAILVGIIGLGALTSLGGSPPDTNALSNVSAPAAETVFDGDVFNTAEPADETIGEAQTFYAARDAALRIEPSSSSTELGTLRRGTSVFGIRLRPAGSDEVWVRIESGAHAGAYVWLANMSDEARPTLARTLAQQWAISGEVGLYAAPDEASRRLDTLSAGLNVQVAGELENGWWEVARQNGGVAYVPPWAFDYAEAEGEAGGGNMSAGFDNAIVPSDMAPGALPSRTQAPPAQTVSWCAFKSGEEIRLTEEECRARGGQWPR